MGPGYSKLEDAPNMTDVQGEDIPPHIEEEMKRTAVSRREFLKLSGMGAMAAIVASCRAPVEHVVPKFQASAVTKPGLAYHYASTCDACSSNCGVVMKVRDGRPIKAEGNKEHTLSRGGLCGQGQASLLSLYDPDRLRHAMSAGKKVEWAALNKQVQEALAAAPAGSVRVLSGTINSPTTNAVLSRFTDVVQGAKHVSYDAVASDAIAAAHKMSHGVEGLPHYQFDRADVIVSFGADFLGSWISPMEFSRDWASKRSLVDGNTMSRHIQFESSMSLTGSNADARYRLVDSERGAALVALAKAVAKQVGASDPFDAPAKLSLAATKIEEAAKALAGVRGKSLVVCGSNDLNEQLVVNYINNILGNYDASGTVDLTNLSQQKLGSTAELNQLVDDMQADKVSVLILYGVNPVYDLPNGDAFAEALKKVGTSVAIADRVDETASHCHHVAPGHHWLEAWNDHEPVKGVFSLAQPTVRPLHDTQAAQESFLIWAGVANFMNVEVASGAYHKMLRNHWEQKILGGASWTKAVEAGGKFPTSVRSQGSASFKNSSVTKATGSAASTVSSAEGLEVNVYESIGLGDGRHANNPWLHEMPDPISKVTWDNYAALSPKTFDGLKLKNNGDIVSITAKVDGREVSYELPAFRQPGQAEGTVAIALGYGRTHAGRMAVAYAQQSTVFGPVRQPKADDHEKPEVGQAIGVNAYRLIASEGQSFATVKATGATSKLALSQTYDSERDGTFDERPIVREATLAEFKHDPESGNKDAHYDITMWKGHDDAGHNYNEQPNRWGVAINLNSCTGCSACVVACQSENNLPVVGKDEVWRRRDMHWMRIDRYYTDGVKSEKDVDAEPTAKHQPMFCQHCENAPCETVCPVGATAHSEDGLNNQAYNRCVGTRYCANNCPYKVRRFNWFNYSHEDKHLNLALNPDVTIRTRGIMEKCSLCVQRAQDAKLAARKDGRTKVNDGEFLTACQQSCPTEAIVVGNINDKTSQVSKLKASPRNYGVIEEIGVKPQVTYLTKIRNTGE